MSTVPVQAASLDVITMGEAMCLLIAQEPGALCDVAGFQRAPAGAELNVAVGLSRLGFKVAYLSRLGADSLGEHLRQFMLAEGIDLRFTRTDPVHRTGLMFKTRSTDGSDPQVEYFRRGSAASHMDCADLPAADAAFGGARHLHLTGISPALSDSVCALSFELAERAQAQGLSISFDPNLRPSLWPSQQQMVATLNRLADQADLVMPGLAEGRVLTGCERAEDIADFYLKRGASRVVVKLGPQGAYCADRVGSYTVPGQVVPQVVDTVGAGDGFAVGVLSALLEGLSLKAAAARGNQIGARVVQFPGDSDGLPTRAQLLGARGAA